MPIRRPIRILLSSPSSCPRQETSMASLSSSKRQVANEQAAYEVAYDQGWTDGLPVVVPTPERVSAFLAHAGLEPDAAVAHYQVRNRTLSAEKAAINAVMAGCKAEYFPVVVAA